MYRGKVTAVDASGVYVQTAEYGTLGPCQAVVANYAVADMVLCVNVGDEASPELVVVGRLTGKGSAAPGSSVDNTVARYNGTGGALQGSGVTINDDGNLTADGVLKVTKDGSNAWVQRVTAGLHDIYDTWSINGYQRFYVFATQSAWGLVTEADLSGGRITALSVDRTTGKTTLGSVGSTAGLEMGSGGPTWTVGTGVPSHSAPNGSLHSRTDGGSGTTLYVRESGSWVGK